MGANKLLEPSYSANDHYEYWFPRPVNKSVADSLNSNPLVILGGGREASGPGYELGVTDDSVINPTISETLRRFLPAVYPNGWFDKDRAPEMEWVNANPPWLASYLLAKTFPCTCRLVSWVSRHPEVRL